MLDAMEAAVRAKRRELIAQPLDRIYRQLIIAALGAMREPDEAMKAAVRDIGGAQWVANAMATWPTMLDVVIDEHGPVRA